MHGLMRDIGDRSFIDSVETGAYEAQNVEIRTIKNRSETEWANADLNRGPPGYQPSAQPD